MSLCAPRWLDADNERIDVFSFRALERLQVHIDRTEADTGSGVVRHAVIRPVQATAASGVVSCPAQTFDSSTLPLNLRVIRGRKAA